MDGSFYREQTTYSQPPHLPHRVLRPVKARSRITNWEGWPREVRGLLGQWNRDKDHLTFVRYGRQLAHCVDCSWYVSEPTGTVAVYRGQVVCDDCLYLIAESYLKEREARTDHALLGTIRAHVEQERRLRTEIDRMKSRGRRLERQIAHDQRYIDALERSLGPLHVASIRRRTKEGT